MDEVATGFEVYSNSQLDGRIKLSCTDIKAGYSLANTNTQTVNGYAVRGIKSTLNTPWGTGQDDQYHNSQCPPGTFVTGISIYASSYLDGQMTCYCSGIKKNKILLFLFLME